MKESQQAQSKPAQGMEVSAAVQQRQSWRPMAFQQAESLVARIIGRAHRMGYRSEQLSSWYEQFTHRLQPWGGWSPLSMELRQEEPLAGAESVRNSGKVRRSQVTPLSHFTSEMPLAQADKMRERITTPTMLSTPEASSLPLNVSEATSLPLVSTPSRSPLRLAILRSPSIASNSHTRQEQQSLPGLPLIVAPQEQHGSQEQHGFEEHALLSPLQTRLGLSVSLAPRREIRGGFPQPSGRPEPRGTAEVPATYLPLELSRGTSSLPIGRARALSRKSPEIEEIGSSHLSSLPDRMDFSSPPSQAAPSAIEQLIEQTTVPCTLPGLELRLVSPESVRAHPPDSSDRPKEKPSPSPASPTLSHAQPTPPLPPPLDINAVTDQVYQKLQHRQRFERERRGWY